MFCSSGSGCASLTRIVSGITTGLPELVALRAEFGPDIVCASLSDAWPVQAKASATNTVLRDRSRRCLIDLLFRPSERRYYTALPPKWLRCTSAELAKQILTR